jgi:2-amino-4-hydroxy-6-hydroxymethyldihydropteridine diphosphokinase
MRSGYLGLGSNVGDRESHLRAAIELLGERGVEIEAVSSAYETEPVGEVLDQADFLNAAIRIRTGLEPEALLDLCKEIEVERGRALDGPRHRPSG